MTRPSSGGFLKGGALHLAAALVALGLVTAASAHFGERTDSLWGFVARSDVVVIGTVTRTRRFEEKGHTTLPGTLQLRVDELLYGRVGSAGLGIFVEGMHQPRYDDGEQVLVFARRKDGILRSLQSRTEKVAVDGKIDPAIAAVRRYVELRAEDDPKRRLERLKDLTLELLRSPAPRLHQDAVFDLSRRGLLDPVIADEDIRNLGELALDERRPLVVREGIVAKLGGLVQAGRLAALTPLVVAGSAAENPAVRVAALTALVSTRRGEATRPLLDSLSSPSFYVRRAAIEGLGTLRTAEAVAPLAEALRDADRRIRFAAIRSLQRIGTTEASRLLQRIRATGSEDDRHMLAQAGVKN